jgi:hypothetical protein
VPSVLSVPLQDQLFRGLEAALGTAFSSEPLAPPPQPMILVISGPSGVGKDAVIKVTHHRSSQSLIPLTFAAGHWFLIGFTMPDVGCSAEAAGGEGRDPFRCHRDKQGDEAR